MNRTLLACASALVLAFAANASTHGTYGVKARIDKHTEFPSLRTYVWRSGWAAFNHDIDQRVVAAIDAELLRAGLEKRASEPCDVVVTYAAIQRMDVDVKKKVPGRPKLRPLYEEYPVGTLIVIMTDPYTDQELFSVRGDMPLALDDRAIDQQIATLVSQMFAKYPADKERPRDPLSVAHQ